MRLLQFCLLFLIAALVQPALAAQRDRDITRQELQNFDNFLDSHPAIERDLERNPALAKDTSYLSAHPDLQQYLDTHPGVREEMRENPSRFIKRERQFEKKGSDVTRAEAKTLDDFLDKHPAIDKDLSKHPELANDPAYVAKHPDF